MTQFDPYCCCPADSNWQITRLITGIIVSKLTNAPNCILVVRLLATAASFHQILLCGQLQCSSRELNIMVLVLFLDFFSELAPPFLGSFDCHFNLLSPWDFLGFEVQFFNIHLLHLNGFIVWFSSFLKTSHICRRRCEVIDLQFSVYVG